MFPLKIFNVMWGFCLFVFAILDMLLSTRSIAVCASEFWQTKGRNP